MQRTTAIHDQLKAAREARREDLATLAARVGMREAVLRAVEDGRFDDLPAGIYGRAAIRAYAAAVGREPQEVLAACERDLKPLEDPVARLACLHGLRRTAVPDAASTPVAPASSPREAGPPFRPLAAAAIDAAIVVLALLAATFCAMPPSALGSRSAIGFGAMGIVLAGAYFASVGGIAGATIGEQVAGCAAPVRGRIALGDIALRACQSATIDARALIDAGARAAAAARLLRVHEDAFGQR